MSQMLHGTTKLTEKDRDAALAFLSEFKDVIALEEDELDHPVIVQCSFDIGN